MRKNPTLRFWIEAGLGSLTTCLLVLTLAWKDWIEAVFHVDPDHHSGSLEWIIAGALFAASVTLFTAARAEWRNAPAPLH